MNEFLNKTGLSYFYNRIKTIFANQTDLSALEDRVDEIIAEGGEPNKIDTIKLNGVALTPDAQKAVNIEALPAANVEVRPTSSASTLFITDLSDNSIEFIANNNGLSYNDSVSGDTINLASIDYVDENGGKIDKIKVNGTDQTITNKTVNLDVAEVSATNSDEEASITVQSTNNSLKAASTTNGVTLFGASGSTTLFNKELVDKNYVDTNGGKIDKIKVNGTEQTITNKEVNIAVPTAVSELTNDSKYQTETEVQDAIDAAVTSVYKYKGSVATVADLPATGNKVGDVYDVQATGVNYAWNGTAWDPLGSYVDVSSLWSKSELTAITTAEIDELFA